MAGDAPVTTPRTAGPATRRLPVRVRAVTLAGVLGLALLTDPALAPGQSPAPVGDAGAPPVLSGPPEAMRQALAEAYRPRPDRRAVLAVSQIHHLLTGEPVTVARIEFDGGVWRVRHAGQEVGTLPEVPEFEDLLALLDGWARRVHERAPLRPVAGPPDPARAEIERRLARLAAPHLLAALRLVDRRLASGVRDPVLFADAARALVWLAVQALDRVEVADLVAAKALATLALTRGPSSGSMAREEALLAWAMGYSTHAARVAGTLAVDDAVRAFLSPDDRRLAEAAERADAAVEAGYLWSLRLAQSGDADGWSRFRPTELQEPDFALPVVRAALELGRVETRAAYATRLPALVRQALRREEGGSGGRSRAEAVAEGLEAFARRVSRGLWQMDGFLRSRLGLRLAWLDALASFFELVGVDLPAALRESAPVPLARIEAELEGAARRQLGPLLDGDTYRAFYRGYLYSALLVGALDELEQGSSGRGPERFADWPDEARDGPAADFQRWYRRLAESRSGRAEPPRLLDDLGALPHLGVALLERTFEELKERTTYGDPVLWVGARRLAARLDTRARHRRVLADLAYSALNDLRLAEAWYHAALRAAADPSLAVWFANLTGDAERLWALLRSPGATLDVQANVLRNLEQSSGFEPDVLRGEYRRLIDEQPGDWARRAKYVDYLERTRDYAGARAVIGEWLGTHGPGAGFPYIFARTALARMFYHEGRYEDGLAAVEPVVKSGQAGAMERMALILDRLGRREEAEAMARRVSSAYADLLRTRVLLAELLWRHGKPREAADVLQAFPRSLSDRDWTSVVAPRFAEAIAERPKEEALAALSALLGPFPTPSRLEQLAFPVARSVAAAGQPELAFRMLEPISPSGLLQLVVSIEAYRHLQAWQGQDAAVAWLRGKVAAVPLDLVGTVAYDRGAFDLLWAPVGTSQGAYPEFVWLLRAAAFLRQGREGSRHKAALDAYYGRPRGGWYDGVGRFLLGHVTEREALALATTPKARCEVAYYVGLRVEAEGRYADASDWYRVSVETGLSRNGEYRWALGALGRWTSEGKSLARLAAEKR